MKKTLKYLNMIVAALAMGMMVSACGGDGDGGGSSALVVKTYDVILKVKGLTNDNFRFFDYKVYLNNDEKNPITLIANGESSLTQITEGTAMTLTIRVTPKENISTLMGRETLYRLATIDGFGIRVVNMANYSEKYETPDVEPQVVTNNGRYLLSKADYFCGTVNLVFNGTSVSVETSKYEFDQWPCHFSYDNSIHLDMTLNMAMNPNDPGTFCLIWEETQKGTKYICFKNNRGEQSRLPETAQEIEYRYQLGLNNGIYVGFAKGIFDNNNNFAFMGFDAQCPNCVRRTNNTLNPNFGIQVDEKGIGTCRECGKHYDLNSGGLILDCEEGDMNMEQYVAATQGPNGHISVFRR